MFRADALRRVFASSGGVFAAFGVGLAAYASHAVLAAGAQAPLQTAAMFALLHGIALAALAPAPAGRTRLCALAILALGTLCCSRGRWSRATCSECRLRLRPSAALC